MTRAFGATDAHGAWVWKDAYEAAEAALVLFLQRYGRLMRQASAAGGPAAMLAMLEQLAALEPSHTRRSEQQLALQQFSTPSRSPTPRCRPPPSAPATPCSNPPPAPACWPSWPSARSVIAPPAPCI